MAQLTFEAFPLQPQAYEWLTLLKANGGESAPLLSEVGNNSDLWMCCLLLPPSSDADPWRTHLVSESYRLYNEVPTQRRLEQIMRGAGEWGAIYRRIAIVVPVVVKDGIAMAQGIRKLDVTAYAATRGLGMELLAHVAFHFRLQYLFLSPIGPFAHHVQNTLDERGVPYGELRRGSLFKELNEATRTEEQHTGIAVAQVEQLYEQAWYDAVQLRIEPSQFRNRESYELFVHPHASTRVLDLDPRRLETAESRRQNGRMRVRRGLEYYNFLWTLAGNGIFAIDGLCLSLAVLGESWI